MLLDCRRLNGTELPKLCHLDIASTSTSGNCSGAKGRKGQHRVGLAIKDKIVMNACKADIALECISARLLKARISIKSNFVTFVVAHAPTKEAPEGRRPNTWQSSTAPYHQCPLGIRLRFNRRDRQDREDR